jgi:pSer/pThr/pTyr-binding forkhead associated (FHA) protein
VNVITRGSSNASIRGQNTAAGESTVELAASSVSKYHATLELHREGLLWFLTDLGSTNGVFISKSGRRLRCHPHCKYGMSSGDRVR